jgi:elongation factor P hydroxylase
MYHSGPDTDIFWSFQNIKTMALFTQTFTQTLVIENCCNCGIAFGMSRDFYNRKREDHTWFYCPNGHGQHYTGKSETEQLRDQIKQKDESLEYYSKRITNLHSEITKKNHEIRGQKAAKTRIVNRVKNGVCPCCNRTFANLQNHFKTKHPELLEHGKAA